MKKLVLTLLVLSFQLGMVVHADDKDELRVRGLVDKANLSVRTFAADSNMSFLRDNLEGAKGLLIIPALIKGAFIFGGSGGSGVLLAKDAAGRWSYPAFYTMGSGSIGFQWGAEVSEIVLMIMTQNGMDSLLTSSFKLGADTSIAAGPIGVGAKAQAADILAFSKTKGVFAGVSLEGAVIKVRPRYNEVYYGRQVRPTDIFIGKTVSNVHADDLRQSVATLVQESSVSD